MFENLLELIEANPGEFLLVVVLVLLAVVVSVADSGPRVR